MTRAARSSEAAWPICGAQPSTGTVPRMIRAVDRPTAGRRVGATRPAAGSAPSGAVEPARLREAGAGMAAFQHVLAVEVRALAIAVAAACTTAARPSLNSARKASASPDASAKKLSSGIAGCSPGARGRGGPAGARSWGRRRGPRRRARRRPPRRTITTRRGSRVPAALASLGRWAQANMAPPATSSARREGEGSSQQTLSGSSAYLH